VAQERRGCRCRRCIAERDNGWRRWRSLDVVGAANNAVVVPVHAAGQLPDRAGPTRHPAASGIEYGTAISQGMKFWSDSGTADAHNYMRAACLPPQNPPRREKTSTFFWL